jgi:hypothetical protein
LSRTVRVSRPARRASRAADRLAAEEVLAVMPEMAQVARGVRMFLAAVVHYLAADAGIRQFLETVGPCLLRFSRCSLIAVAAAGLLLPEGFSRCCPQPGYRSGCDQG